MSGDVAAVKDVSPGYAVRAGMPSLPVGYKKTEVGLIPEDWQAICLADAVKRITRGASPRPIDSPVWFDPKSQVGWVRISDVTRAGRYLYETLQKLSEAGIRNSRPVPAGSLIMSICATVGRPIETRIDVCIHDGFVVFEQPRIDQSFLYHTLVSLEPTWSKHGQTGSQMNLNTGLINGCLIAIPPSNAEQRAIATALSDVDALLEELDRLISKKRDLKQATMQKLLTGQTRIPGFEGEWETKRLGDVFSISAGSSKSSHISAEGDYWICDMGSVSVEGKLIVSKRTSYQGDFLLAGDLIMPKDDIGGGKIIGKVGYIDQNDVYILGDHVYCLRAREGDSQFLSYRINSYETNSALRKKVIGSAQLGIGRRSVEEQEIRLPSSTEQTAIATVLSEMDAEIEALQERCTKTRSIKQAMMQELLTGRTRLV